MSDIGWLIIYAALGYFVVKYGAKLYLAYHAAAERERMRRVVDWDNRYRRERNRKKHLSSRSIWQKLGLSS